MKKIEIIKSVVVVVAMTLFILTKTTILEGNKMANGISAFLIVAVLGYYLATAVTNIKSNLNLKK